MQRHFAGLPNVACFDTTFHAAMPDVARVLPLPRDLKASGIRRYGFHGLSCESIVDQLGDFLPQRLIIAHLGNGASVKVQCTPGDGLTILRSQRIPSNCDFYHAHSMPH